jgi:hypothetical protein
MDNSHLQQASCADLQCWSSQNLNLTSMQIDLPVDSVALAYDLVHVEELADNTTVAHVGLAQDADGTPLLAVLSGTGRLTLYGVDVATGGVVKRPAAIEGVEAIVTIELCAPHLTGTALCLLLLAQATVLARDLDDVASA